MHAEVLFLPAPRTGVRPGDKAGQDENVTQRSVLPHTVCFPHLGKGWSCFSTLRTIREKG